MLEGLREAMEFLTDLKTEANKTEVLEINGKTYAVCNCNGSIYLVSPG